MRGFSPRIPRLVALPRRPLGRLSGTVRWIVVLTFGSTEQADREIARVGRFHQKVEGEYAAGDGSPRRYTATDLDLVDWVHLTFADAFLTCHEVWGGPIPGGGDAYVRCPIVGCWACGARFCQCASQRVSRCGSPNGRWVPARGRRTSRGCGCAAWDEAGSVRSEGVGRSGRRGWLRSLLEPPEFRLRLERHPPESLE